MLSYIFVWDNLGNFGDIFSVYGKKMKKKMTFYIDEELERNLIIWITKYLEMTGKKITKTDVINMLLNALLETKSIEEDIKDMQ